MDTPPSARKPASLYLFLGLLGLLAGSGLVLVAFGSPGVAAERAPRVAIAASATAAEVTRLREEVKLLRHQLEGIAKQRPCRQ